MTDKRDKSYMGMGVFSAKKTQHVPVGMEQVLVAAASDESFRERLLEDRQAAVAAAGFQLSETEKAVLDFAPKDQLAAMIDGLDTTEKSLERRGFMKAVAATVVTIAASGALEGCKEDAPAKTVNDAPGTESPPTAPPPQSIQNQQGTAPPPPPANEPSEKDAGTLVEIPKPEKNIKGGARPDVEGHPKKKKKKLPIEGPPGLSRGITRD